MMNRREALIDRLASLPSNTSLTSLAVDANDDLRYWLPLLIWSLTNTNNTSHTHQPSLFEATFTHHKQANQVRQYLREDFTKCWQSAHQSSANNGTRDRPSAIVAAFEAGPHSNRIKLLVSEVHQLITGARQRPCLLNEPLFFQDIAIILPLSVILCPTFVDIKRLVTILIRVPHGSEYILRLCCARPSSLHYIITTLFDILHRQLIGNSTHGHSHDADTLAAQQRSSSSAAVSIAAQDASDVKRTSSQTNMNDSKRASPSPSPSPLPASSPSPSPPPSLTQTTTATGGTSLSVSVNGSFANNSSNVLLIGVTRALWRIGHLSTNAAIIIRGEMARVLTLFPSSSVTSRHGREARHYCASFIIALSVSVIHDVIEFMTHIFTLVQPSAPPRTLAGQRKSDIARTKAMTSLGTQWTPVTAMAIMEYLQDRRTVVPSTMNAFEEVTHTDNYTHCTLRPMADLRRYLLSQLSHRYITSSSIPLLSLYVALVGMAKIVPTVDEIDGIIGLATRLGRPLMNLSWTNHDTINGDTTTDNNELSGDDRAHLSDLILCFFMVCPSLPSTTSIRILVQCLRTLRDVGSNASPPSSSSTTAATATSSGGSELFMCIASLLHCINTMGPCIGVTTNVAVSSSPSSSSSNVAGSASPTLGSIAATASVPTTTNSNGNGSASTGVATPTTLTMEQKKSLTIICGMIRRRVQWPITITFDGLHQIAPLITEHVITEYQAIRRCFMVSSSHHHIASMLSSNVLLCIHELLRCGIVRRSMRTAATEVGHWLVHLLTYGGAIHPPLRHALLAPIMEGLASTCLQYTASSPAATKWDLRLVKDAQMNTLLQSPLAANTTDGDSNDQWRSLSIWKHPISLILPAYYMMYYNAAHRVALRNSGTIAPSSRAYAPVLLHHVPLYSALIYMQSSTRGDGLEYMVAPYQTLMMDQYPEVISVDGLLFRHHLQSEMTAAAPQLLSSWITTYGAHGAMIDYQSPTSGPYAGILSDGRLPSPHRVGQLLAVAIDEPQLAIALLSTIYRLTKPLVTISTGTNTIDPLIYVDPILRTILPLAIRHSSTTNGLLARPIVELFRDLWECWRAMFSLQLPLRTLLVIATPIVNTAPSLPLSSSWTRMETTSTLSISSLINDPLTILTIHHHGIWRYPPLIRVLLHILHAFLSASRRHYTMMIDDALHVPPPPPSSTAPPRPAQHAAGPAAAAAAVAAQQAAEEAKRLAAIQAANGAAADGNVVAAEINTLLLSQESTSLHWLFEACGRTSRLVANGSTSSSDNDNDVAGGTLAQWHDTEADEFLALCDAAVGTGRTRTTLGGAGTISNDEAKIWDELEHQLLRLPLPSAPSSSPSSSSARSVDAVERQKRIEALWSSRSPPPSEYATESSVGWSSTTAITIADEATRRRTAASGELCGETGAFIHQQFIANPLLIKLVHFQGYPTHIIPAAIEGVASMHACLDFIPELLHQPHHDQQVFALHLLSYLSEKYPMPSTLSMCNDVLREYARAESVSVHIPALRRSLPPLVRLARVFPPLANDVMELLLRIRPDAATINSDSPATDIQSFILVERAGYALLTTINHD